MNGMNHRYHTGAGARKKFDETMTKLFRAPKPPKPEKQPKKKAASEEMRS
jgi:hypothetical protein